MVFKEPELTHIFFNISIIMIIDKVTDKSILKNISLTYSIGIFRKNGWPLKMKYHSGEKSQNNHMKLYVYCCISITALTAQNIIFNNLPTLSSLYLQDVIIRFCVIEMSHSIAWCVSESVTSMFMRTLHNLIM